MDYISLKIQNTAIYLYEKQTNPFPNWGYGILLLMIFTICERESYFLTRRTRGCIFFIFIVLVKVPQTIAIIIQVVSGILSH